MRAKQGPRNPGGRLIDIHGTLVLSDVVMKNAVGVNDGGTFYINGGRLEITRVTFANCYGGNGDGTKFHGVTHPGANMLVNKGLQVRAYSGKGYL
jgi:hypothetical protein